MYNDRHATPTTPYADVPTKNEKLLEISPNNPPAKNNSSDSLHLPMLTNPSGITIRLDYDISC
jgi:hypothetical protein